MTSIKSSDVSLSPLATALGQVPDAAKSSKGPNPYKPWADALVKSGVTSTWAFQFGLQYGAGLFAISANAAYRMGFPQALNPVGQAYEALFEAMRAARVKG